MDDGCNFFFASQTPTPTSISTHILEEKPLPTKNGKLLRPESVSTPSPEESPHHRGPGPGGFRLNPDDSPGGHSLYLSFSNQCAGGSKYKNVKNILRQQHP